MVVAPLHDTLPAEGCGPPGLSPGCSPGNSPDGAPGIPPASSPDISPVKLPGIPSGSEATACVVMDNIKAAVIIPAVIFFLFIKSSPFQYFGLIYELFESRREKMGVWFTVFTLYYHLRALRPCLLQLLKGAFLQDCLQEKTRIQMLL